MNPIPQHLRGRISAVVAISAWERGHDCLVLERDALTEESFAWLRTRLGPVVEQIVRQEEGVIAVVPLADLKSLPSSEQDRIFGPKRHTA